MINDKVIRRETVKSKDGLPLSNAAHSAAAPSVRPTSGWLSPVVSERADNQIPPQIDREREDIGSIQNRASFGMITAGLVHRARGTKFTKKETGHVVEVILIAMSRRRGPPQNETISMRSRSELEAVSNPIESE